MDSNFSIHNMGATINGFSNNDGTYTVTTKGSKAGSKPVVQILTEDEVIEKFGRKTNLQQDEFQGNMGSKFTDAANAFVDYTKNFPTVKYNPIINSARGMEAAWALANGDKEKAEAILSDAPNMFDIRNPYLYL